MTKKLDDKDLKDVAGAGEVYDEPDFIRPDRESGPLFDRGTGDAGGQMPAENAGGDRVSAGKGTPKVKI
jgi:hypothetical protein